MKSFTKKVWLEAFLDKFPLPYSHVAIITGALIYATGVLVSLYTGNLTRFICDFPWIVYSIYLIIGMWATPHYLKLHRRAFYSVRKMFCLTDEEFQGYIHKFNERLASLFSIPFSLIFFPILFWVSMNRLWWQDYNRVFLYDVYSWVIFALVLVANGVGIWVGCVAFNLNYRDVCEKIPLDVDYLISDRFESINMHFGSLCLQITLLYLIFSTLSNLPIIILTKNQGAIINFIVALTLTFVVFIIPQILFHRLILKITKAEKDRIRKLSEIYSKKPSETMEDEKPIYEKIYDMLASIQLFVYSQDIDKIRKWLLDIRSLSIVIISLFLSTTVKIFIGDILGKIISFVFSVV